MQFAPHTWAAWLDDRCRISDMKVQRFDENLLRRFGVKRQNIEAFLLPSLIATALWTGMPTLGIRQLTGILVGLVCFAILVLANRKSRSSSQDLCVQVGLLFLVSGIIWFLGPDEAGLKSLVYRNLLVPVVIIVALSLLLAIVMAKKLCEPLQGISQYAAYLGTTELFQSRGTRLPLADGALSRVLFAILGTLLRPLQLLWPVAIVILIAPPAYVTLAAWIMLALMGCIQLLAVNDERLDNSLHLLMNRFFRNAALGVTLISLALAAARLLHNTYVTTIFDAASGIEILLYFFFAYAIAWWYDYWTERLIGQQLFLLIDPLANGACSTQYNYTGPKATSVPLAGRRVELHGLGRFLAYCPNPAKPKEPYFQAWPYNDFFSHLATSGAAGGKAVPLPQQVSQRITGYLGYTGIVIVALLAGGGMLLHRTPKAHEIAVASNQPASLTFASLIAGQGNDPAHPAILVAASGGGTRAAIFTGAVLEGLSISHGQDIRVGSGVSGGAAALAYYASKRPELALSSQEAWDQFFHTMSMPFIQDVIERAPEWRMVEHGRLGVLLAESFERRWNLAENRKVLGGVNDFGLICNATLAGRFDRSFLTADENKGLTLGEAAARYASRTRSDVAGGRLILTNLDLQQAFASSDLSFVPGEHLPILVNDREVRVERAAALSANFPPVFSNAAIDVDDRHRYWVTDGGAADNRGLEPLLYGLRDALRNAGRGDTKLPAVSIVIIEASGIDDSFQQDRGVGSALGAGAHYADQVNIELADSLMALYQAAHQEKDIQFFYVAMPKMLRKSGSFGTHWMLQDSIDVSNESEQSTKADKKTFKGTQVVTALRAAYACQPAGTSTELVDWIAGTPEFKQWCGMWSALAAGSGSEPCACKR